MVSSASEQGVRAAGLGKGIADKATSLASFASARHATIAIVAFLLVLRLNLAPRDELDGWVAAARDLDLR